MIYLYESTETDFRYNGKPLPLAYQVSVHFTVNAEFYVTGKYPLDDKGVYKEIIEDRIVKVHTPHGMEPFRIMSAPKSDTYVEFEAWPLFYADMRNKLVKPLNLRNATGQTAVNQFVNSLLIDTPFQFYSNIQDTHDYHTQDKEERENNPNQFYDALEVFSNIVRRWNGEVRIRGYDIRINDSIGIDTEEMLYERKNIASFVDSTNIEGIVTRVHGKSEWIEEAQEGEEEGQKRSVQATVDSPLINEYSGIIFEKQYTNNGLRTEKEMENWLKLKFSTENIDKPKRTIEVGTNVIGNSKINAGDTLILKYVMHDVDVRIKVVGYEYDGMGNEYINFVFGEPKTSSASTIGNSVTDLVNNIVRPIERKALEARASANSKNTNFYGKEEPTGTGIQTGDLWYKPVGNGERELYRFTGTIWELEKVSAGLLSGTLDAQNGDVNLINVNVASIVGETAQFIRAGVVDASGNTVDLDGKGISIIRGDGSRSARLGVNGYEFWIDGAEHGTIGIRKYVGTDPTYANKKTLSLYARKSSYISLSYQGDKTSSGDGYAAMTILGDSGDIEIASKLSVRKELNLRGGIDMNGYGTSNQGGVSFGLDDVVYGRIYSVPDSGQLQIRGSSLLRFVVGGQTKMDINHSTAMDIYTNINMRGNSITNSPSVSDGRLKTIQSKRTENDLNKLMEIEYQNVAWNESGEEDVAFIAQQVQRVMPEIITTMSNGYLGYNQQTYVNMIGHAVQQLSLREENTNKIANQALESTESNESKIHKLQQELSKANRRIEELENING